MLKDRINNSFLEKKILLRKKAIKHLTEINVLDLFAGRKKIWKKIDHDFYIGIDKNEKSILYGDNRKYISEINLSVFNVIDCDAWGSPYPQIELLLKNKTLQKNTIIFFTFIPCVFGALHRKMLEKIGYSTEMLKKIPTLFYKNPFEKFKKYLSLANFKYIHYIVINGVNPKYYGYIIFNPE